ncbi:WhiB family transcriptional regulator [Gordonia sp. CPCC 205515]|uniref:WhiB family transcriptional regulator n=1 Tax=Gordonia sp. CPCC 205515 TaxID=3140791 RepID=UPI003AF3427C
MTVECVLDSPLSTDLMPVGRLDLPCQVADADLWFAEDPRDLEQAKAMCADCPLQQACLQAALERAEPWGVWGGEIFDRGAVVARKRPRGRPRKNVA